GGADVLGLKRGDAEVVEEFHEGFGEEGWIAAGVQALAEVLDQTRAETSELPLPKVERNLLGCCGPGGSPPEVGRVPEMNQGQLKIPSEVVEAPVVRLLLLQLTCSLRALWRRCAVPCGGLCDGEAHSAESGDAQDYFHR